MVAQEKVGGCQEAGIDLRLCQNIAKHEALAADAKASNTNSTDMVKKSTNTTDGIPVPVMAHPGTLEEWIASHTKYSGRSTLLPAELRELRKDYQKALTKYNHFAATAAVFIASFESQGKVANANEELAATNKDMHEKSLNALNQVLLSDPSRTENESNESIAGKAGRKQRSRTPTAASRLPKKAPTKKSAKKKVRVLSLWFPVCTHTFSCLSCIAGTPARSFSP